jgi:hypothetical protein
LNVGGREEESKMESNIQHDQTKMQMNVSGEADAEFMRLLESEDPKRYARLMQNIRRDNPSTSMSEHQALANWQLGLPTGQWRFTVIAGDLAPVSKLRAAADRLLHEGPTEEYVEALLTFASAPDFAPEVVTLRAACKTSSVAPRKMRLRMKQARAGRKAAATRSRAENGVFQ